MLHQETKTITRIVNHPTQTMRTYTIPEGIQDWFKEHHPSIILQTLILFIDGKNKAYVENNKIVFSDSSQSKQFQDILLILDALTDKKYKDTFSAHGLWQTLNFLLMNALNEKVSPSVFLKNLYHDFIKLRQI